MSLKKVSGDIPFMFLHEMGHDTRAMERFFSLPPESRKNLEDSVCIAEHPDERASEAVRSLSEYGEGYFEPY